MRKKIIYGACMLGLVALVATSCKKKEDNTNSFASNYGTFQAVIIDGERAYFDPETLLTYWDENDQIKVFNFANGRACVFQTQDAGQNTGNFVSLDGAIGSAPGYYAFYPASMAEADFDGEYQTFELKAIQKCRATDEEYESYAMQDVSIPQAAYTTAQERHFYFNIIFGMAKFKLKCGPGAPSTPGGLGVTRYVEKIVVRDNHFNLHGTVTLRPNKIWPDTLSAMMTRLKAGGVNDPQYKRLWNEYVINELGYSAIPGENGTTLTYDYTALNNGKGVKLSANHDMYLWVGLRPGAFAYGFEVDLYVRDGEDMKIITIDKWKNPTHHLMAATPAIINTFNVGPITTLVDQAQPVN